MRWLSFLLLCVTLFSCSSKEKEEERSHKVLVSIAPYKFFVQQVAGDTVNVQQMVPTGASPHSYEPTAKQILDASHADVWFQIGEPLEVRATQALQSSHPTMRFIDMLEGLDLIPVSSEDDSHHHCKHHGCYDPHVWLSPKLVKQQAEKITETLIELYPENAQLYRNRLKDFEEKLDRLDAEIAKQLLPIKNQTIIVSHPAYAYFGRDYHLHQLSIEFEGKEPSPQQLTKILNEARKLKPHAVFVQPQHFSKGTRLIADQLNAQIIILDPLAENYFDNMRTISKKILEK